MVESVEPSDEIFDNKPIIIKDKYAVSGSDMAQIGWIEVTTENGASGYLWYLKLSMRLVYVSRTTLRLQ
jgi:hypothetical protein